jgi:hypothetical protein
MKKLPTTTAETEELGPGVSPESAFLIRLRREASRARVAVPSRQDAPVSRRRPAQTTDSARYGID